MTTYQSDFQKCYPGLQDPGPLAIERDGKLLAVVENANAAFLFLFHGQSHSVAYALRYGGYRVRPATDDERRG